MQTNNTTLTVAQLKAIGYSVQKGTTKFRFVYFDAGTCDESHGKPVNTEEAAWDAARKQVEHDLKKFR